MKKDTAKKIIDQIKEEKIIPDPKWKVNLKSYVFWGLLIFIVLLSAAFFSLALLSVVDFDLELMRQLKLKRYIVLLMMSAPYIWLAMLVLTVVLGFFVFRKTKKGYRYSVLFVASLIFLSVSVLGVGAHVAHVNKKIDEAFARGPKGLHKLVPPGEERFFMPEEGIIAGEIVEKKEGSIIVKTFMDEEWEIFYDEKTKLKKKDLIEKKKVIIALGEKIGEKQFKAEKIKPMRGPGKRIFEKKGEIGPLPEGKGPPLGGRARGPRF